VESSLEAATAPPHPMRIYPTNGRNARYFERDGAMSAIPVLQSLRNEAQAAVKMGVGVAAAPGGARPESAPAPVLGRERCRRVAAAVPEWRGGGAGRRAAGIGDGARRRRTGRRAARAGVGCSARTVTEAGTAPVCGGGNWRGCKTAHPSTPSRTPLSRRDRFDTTRLDAGHRYFAYKGIARHSPHHSRQPCSTFFDALLSRLLF
jgi:hypothetical protein